MSEDIVNIKKIKKEYSNKTLFKDLSFSLNKKNKVALVGSNGSGKTTLLKIISGLVDVDSGSVSVKSKRVGYLPQNIDDFFENKDLIVKEILNSEDKSLYSFFKLENIDKNIRVKDLSLGQKTKIALSILFSKELEIYLLDEPTNNLDFDSIDALQNYIKKSKMAFLIVSHDDYFLQETTNDILDLDSEKPSLIKNTSYIEWRELKKSEYKNEMLIYKEQLKKANKIKKVAQIFHEKANPKNKKQKLLKEGDKIAMREKMRKGYERIEARSSEKKKEAQKIIENLEKPNTHFKTVIKIDGDVTKGKPQIDLNKTNIGYKKTLIKDVTLTIPFGRKVAFIGENGSGKTTLIKTITGDINTISGTINVDKNIKFGHLKQDRDIDLNNKTLFDFFKKETNLEDEDIVNNLVKSGISKELIFNKNLNLSSGEKTRLFLTLFSIMKVNTLILDEPTNHLDLDGIFALEDILETFTGTVIIVSHNRYFLSKLKIDNFYTIKDCKFKETDFIKQSL